MIRTTSRPTFASACGALLLALLTSGCAVLGPAALRGGRAAYNDAIVATNNEQVLAMIVRMRYGEPTGLLAVSSVTASMSIQARAGAEFGVGPDSNFDGNLVPLSSGFAYEENPTISYTPLQGQRYMRQLLSPLPIDLTMLLLRTLHTSPESLTFLLRSINGIHNPDFLAESAAPDPNFGRLVEILSSLARSGELNWAQQSGPNPSFVLVIRAGASETLVSELYGLLGFEPEEDAAGLLALPVRLSIGRPPEARLHLETRSLYELLHLAAAAVDVPPEHLESGIAHPLPPLGPAGQGFQIRRSKSRPKEAVTATYLHDWWYYLDATDARSKLTFLILEALISERVADAANHAAAAPVLTVPVSR